MAASQDEYTFYHKDRTDAQRRAADADWHKDKRAEQRIDRIIGKDVIVWDGEGMKLSGPTKPQHYVLFGCSARPDDPLVIKRSTDRLIFDELADYMMTVAKQFPNAIHLGYYFKYDQNMIIWSLPWPAKHILYDEGSCMVSRYNGTVKYYVKIIFGKTLSISRYINGKKDARILIEDFASFFAKSFVKAYRELFPTPTDPENWAIVEQGKQERAEMLYADMPKVRRYWRAEILALLELATEFRRILFSVDFYLDKWHGPGALARYIRDTRGLAEHEWGGKETNLPDPVHEACKSAYYGGHFEQYQVGRIPGPVYYYDINSAYPTAFCEIPSLAEGGYWEHIGAISTEEWHNRKDLRIGFAVYKISWIGAGPSLGNLEYQPLPHRDTQKNICYPKRTRGWYWAPEVGMVMQMATRRHGKMTCEILDGWIWRPRPDMENVWPWETVMMDMYKRRLTLKAGNNPAQMAMKLGMNSQYGKYAQQAGGKDKAPVTHTLCIAGYITSWCRAVMIRLLYACRDRSVIAVETDGLYTTTPPDKLKHKLNFGKGLGEWSMDVYDEVIILQNGVYLLKQDGKWKLPKSRGIQQLEFLDEHGNTDVQTRLDHLARCGPDERWPVMKFAGKEQFVGLGSCIGRATRVLKEGPKKGKRVIVPFKASDLHCTWVPDKKDLDLEGRGSKRAHYPEYCPTCLTSRLTADKAPHEMIIRSSANVYPWEVDSQPYELPWEKGYEKEPWRIFKEGGPEDDIDGWDDDMMEEWA